MCKLKPKETIIYTHQLIEVKKINHQLLMADKL